VSDLLATLSTPEIVTPRDGITLLRRFADSAELFPLIEAIAAAAPFRQMVTPGGSRMSAAMTNCGRAGWVTDRSGYRYAGLDPVTELPWPAMPDAFRALARRAATEAGFPGFEPDACLMNRYEPGARLGLHQDRDERSYEHPVVSVSLGLPAVFLMKPGQARTGTTTRLRLEDGDVLAFGGLARLMHHGIAPLEPGEHPLYGACRINLTFRRAL
jgi:alkylated DNA repair protein (DNA oxidative demethylase)